MEQIEPLRIQLVSIIVSLGFLIYIAGLVMARRLRAEYSIIWIVLAATLVLFSFWRAGLEFFARLLGVYSGINLAFAVAIFAILIYLLHLSIVSSRLQEQQKSLAQEMALLNKKLAQTPKE